MGRQIPDDSVARAFLHSCASCCKQKRLNAVSVAAGCWAAPLRRIWRGRCGRSGTRCCRAASYSLPAATGTAPSGEHRISRPFIILPYVEGQCMMQQQAAGISTATGTVPSRQFLIPRPYILLPFRRTPLLDATTGHWHPAGVFWHACVAGLMQAMARQARAISLPRV